jgi:hypothetical protein
MCCPLAMAPSAARLTHFPTHLARKVSTQGTDGTKLFNTLLEQQRTNGVEPANYKKQPDEQ